jgi:PAS domain S-box-containing protein
VLTVIMVAMAFALVRRELAHRRQAEAEARRAADDLARSQRDTADTLALLDTFLAHAPIGMAFFDPELRYVRINDHLAAADGRPVEDHLGRGLTDVLPAGAVDVSADLRRVLHTAGPVLNRLVTGRPGGPDRVWQSSYFPVRAKDGRALGVGVVAQDVTDRLAFERELRESVDRFRTLAETVPQMVWVTDPRGRVTLVNRRWQEYTGISLDAAAGGGWESAVHPDDIAGLTAAWHAALAEPGDRFSHEYRLWSAAGDYRWMLAVAVPVRTADGAVRQWVGTLTDIEDQKRQSEVLTTLVRMRTAELESANQLLRDEIAERARAEARAEAAAVELGRSNEELEKFAYVASHDLQEPLRKIQAFGDRLVKKYRDDLGEDGREYVDRMKSSATRMRTLIDDLLTFSRVTTKAQPSSAVDLGEIVADVVSDLEIRVHQTGGRVDVGALPTLEADPMQMRQLFLNLIGNALKFHRPGVPPIVTVQSVTWAGLRPDADPPPPAGSGYRVTVADNGIGFDPVYAERVFELFQRLHGRSEYEGTGIGLAICRKIVQRHGGAIAARGREGEGATFVVDLPAAGQRA